MATDPRTMNIVNPELRGMPLRDYHEELNIRTSRAGHTARNGGPKPLKIQTTVPRGKVKLNIWPRDVEGNLIDD